MTLTAEEARYALDQLISRRKVRPADVTKVLKDRKKEITVVGRAATARMLV
jgi:hypothetical protein